jgi:hypothetical protein
MPYRLGYVTKGNELLVPPVSERLKQIPERNIWKGCDLDNVEIQDSELQAGIGFRS